MAKDRANIETFFAKLKDSPFLMIGVDDTPDHSEPMTAQIDDGVTDALYFFMGQDNRLSIGGEAMAQFVSKGHDFFACLHGTLVPHNDRSTIDRLWSKQFEAWFPGGKDDPSLLLMRYHLDNAEMWESDISLSGRVKMLFGGTIKPQEAGTHSEVAM